MNFLTHHKCASTWLGDYLGQLADLNGLSLISTHRGDVILDPAADLALYRNADYAFLHDRIAGGSHIIRNPLDILVSAYHSHRDVHPTDGWPELEVQRRALRSVKSEEGMMLTLAFIDRADFYERTPGPLYGIRSWDYADDRFATLCMENLVADPSGHLRDALTSQFGHGLILPDPADFSFARFAGGREKGIIDTGSHYRVGTPNTWIDELPAHLAEYVVAHNQSVFDVFYPDTAQAIRSMEAVRPPIT